MLAPFGKGFAAAACAAACPRGLLGWAHSRSGTVANNAGERTGVATTGTNSASGITSGRLVGLGAAGAAIVVLVVFLVCLSYRAAGKKDKERILGGAYVGSVLLLTAGVAGALAWLPSLLKEIGGAAVIALAAYTSVAESAQPGPRQATPRSPAPSQNATDLAVAAAADLRAAMPRQVEKPPTV
ncbi:MULTISPECIES: hypothetical protein [Streptomyces]|uniref:hypothetical protein n=1 Tax=Streptomyces TaxID=1883 RepID=UPI001E397ED3|nr:MULTISPECIES: hypothetical protein [Streptomyces]UFQ18250.1 hypothetical protein J2N69_26430 [Streptomyces huasconensis]WCL87864.1 hypothetical protein PPN52_26430 [Streptomyces sp. JCM 35825]